ncbi:unnamed protein product [Rangifer tarandus platyrhynchus]|uniref:Uncharacterized protein n=1 Tax=Rangifer tarandus platyrhynchus TaxID=3082113 RepID=A0AC59ZP52_RANTA
MRCPAPRPSAAEGSHCEASLRDEVGSPLPVPWRPLSPCVEDVFSSYRLSPNSHPNLYLPKDASTCMTTSIWAPPTPSSPAELSSSACPSSAHSRPPSLGFTRPPSCPPLSCVQSCRVFSVLSPPPTWKSSFSRSLHPQITFGASGINVLRQETRCPRTEAPSPHLSPCLRPPCSYHTCPSPLGGHPAYATRALYPSKACSSASSRGCKALHLSVWLAARPANGPASPAVTELLGAFILQAAENQLFM